MNKITLLPVSKLGKWSVYLLIAFVVLFAIAWIIIVATNRVTEGMGDLSWDLWYLAIPIVLAWASIIVAGITGLISLIKQKEKAVLVFISTFLGLAIIVLFILEFTVLE